MPCNSVVPDCIVPFSRFYSKPSTEFPAFISRKHFEFVRDLYKIISIGQSPKHAPYLRVVFKGGCRVSSPTRQPDWVDWLIHYTPCDSQLRMKKYEFRRCVLFQPGYTVAGPIFGPIRTQECGALPTINDGSNACKHQ